VKLIMETLAESPVARRRTEIVERKGRGHPDTICDSLVEAIALELNRMYLSQVGAVLHYNVDKALLAAGQCAKGFGWGKVTRPMELIVGDRATFAVEGTSFPVEDTVRHAVGAWLKTHLPAVCLDRDLHVRLALAPGSGALREILAPGSSSVVSNDTSGAVGYAPLTPTEGLVLAVERFLNGEEFKAAFPDTGQDVKVMAVREDDRVALTVAMPLICLRTASETAYFRRKREIVDALMVRFHSTPFLLDWRLNNLDAAGRGADGTYLSVTGTSAEDADSGQVGRGNRANGLIAFARPGGGEAAPGKNAVAHVGKIYSVFSHHLARRVYLNVPALEQVYVQLAARIGEPVDEPWTSVQVVLAPGMRLEDVAPVIHATIEKEIQALPAFRAELVRDGLPVC
jgi:S-adenosylmethionine synthetase